MKLMTLAKGVALAALATVSGVVSASTVSPSPTFTVTLTINANCTANTIATLDFGSTTFLTAAIPATTSVTVNCTMGTVATIALSGTCGSRTISNGADTVAYDLYSDASHSVCWASGGSAVSVTGKGVDASGATLDSTTASGTTRTIYGLVPAQSTNTTGAYTGTVTATITF